MSFVKSISNCAILGDRRNDPVHRASVDEIPFRVFDGHLSLVLRFLLALAVWSRRQFVFDGSEGWK